jgi:hypothetical protein
MDQEMAQKYKEVVVRVTHENALVKNMSLEIQTAVEKDSTINKSVEVIDLDE